MHTFHIQSKFKPTGDQPKAIANLVDGVQKNKAHQTLLGVTGSGKTFTMANVIANTQKPTLLISHNKTLAYQLYEELKNFFPKNSIHYFVSYYDYYQPEAYMPQTDTYIDKDVKINEELDRLRHEATQAILSRNDVIVVASVSCIYNIGSPENYQNMSLHVNKEHSISRKELLRHLITLQYQRNDIEHTVGIFKSKGEAIWIYPATGNDIIKITFDLKNKITRIDNAPLSVNPKWSEVSSVHIFPAKYWLAEQKVLPIAIANIQEELGKTIVKFKKENKLLEAQRIMERTHFDMEMLKTAGYCHGIENYSGHIEFREPDSPPFTLLDYFAYAHKDFLTVIDESHMSIPQIRGMHAGDRARKNTLIKYGFRLPSARDNRPLTFEEFQKKAKQIIYMSATPAIYEIEKSHNNITEQLIRPTGLLDPQISIRKTNEQIQDVIKEIKARVQKKQRILLTVLTKKMAEDMSDFLVKEDIKAHYLHSEVKTLERSKILRDLRLGQYDVIVGVNLLREGLDLPEVSLVIIMDADKEGFLRNKTTLIQTMGRAARHKEGAVIMYADTMTKSMKAAIEETKRRRKIQEIYNKKHNITPTQIEKPIEEKKEKSEISISDEDIENLPSGLIAQTQDVKELIKRYTKEMKQAASKLDFEKAQKLKNIITKLKK